VRPVRRGTIGEALLATLTYFIAQLVVGGGAVAVLALQGREPVGPALLAVVVVAQLAGLVAVLALLAVRGRLTLGLLGPRRATGLDVAHGLAVGAGGLVAAYGLNALLAWALGADEPVEQVVVQELLRGGSAVVLAAIAAVALAPVAEELLFRGLLFPALRGRIGVWPAAVVAGLVFTLAHSEVVVSQPVALAGLLVLGTLFAIAYERTGSLVVPIVAHATFNGASLGLAVVADRFGFL
jgi:membrane protease YdiL (CAAX protease family)